jgi:hypothetical protein
MHHELPERLDIEWYRSRARELLREVQRGDAASARRVQEAIGERQGFRLADAQHVIALEHGFARWSDFKRWVETRSPEPKVGRIGRAPLRTYEARAEALVEDVRAGNSDALRRVQQHVPRLRHFDSNALALSDARIVVAREYGFPTWRELASAVQRAIDEHAERPSGDLAAAFAVIGAGDVEGLRRMLDDHPDLVRQTYTGAATTLLEAITQPDVFGDHLEIELGVDPHIVRLLIERGSELDGPLNLAACFNRAELVQMLLQAGARQVSSPIWGITPLQAAVYHGSREAGDLLAADVLAPDALYTAAGAGRLDRLPTFFNAAGGLKPEALHRRANLADVGWPPAPPPRDDPQDVLDEAFGLAAYNGRLEAMQRLLEHGADLNGGPYLGLTALHFAVIRRRLDVTQWLIERGADTSRRDRIHDGTPLGWAEHNAAGEPITAYLRAAAC